MSKNPWVYFLVLFAASVLLSYFSFSLTVQLLVFFGGIVGPVCLWLRQKPAQPKPDAKALPGWIWIAAFCFAVWLRLYHATDLFAWPSLDDGCLAFGPLEFYRTGKPFFFYANNELGPLTGWLQNLYFYFDPPSLSALPRLSALVSLATLPSIYWAARQYFSRGLSNVLWCLLAIGFWPAYIGRTPLDWALTLLWWFLVLGVLGCFLRKPTLGVSIWLGFMTAAGFYFHPPTWAACALIVLMAIAGHAWKNKSFRASFYFLAVFSASLSPLVIQMIRTGYGNHIRNILAFSDFFSLSHLFSVDAGYVENVFWGGPQHQMLYGPWWGGLLDPVTTALCLLGLAQVWAAQKRRALLLSAAVALCLLAGFLTDGVETLRIFAIIPFIGILAAEGWTCLSRVEKPFSRWAAVGLLALAGLLSSYQLFTGFGRGRQPQNPSFTQESDAMSYRAYQLIREKGEKDGPGYLFIDFLHCPLDHTLDVGTFPYNALLNPRWRQTPPTWGCLLTNANYIPFIQARWPRGRWTIVDPAIDPWDGPLALCVFPVTPQTFPMIEQWKKASLLFHELSFQSYRLPRTASHSPLIELLVQNESLTQGDPYLESVFWEALYFNHCTGGMYGAAFQDLQAILQKGYPAAHVYSELGTLYYHHDEPAMAEKMYLKAVQLGGPNTDAENNLIFLKNSTTFSQP